MELTLIYSLYSDQQAGLSNVRRVKTLRSLHTTVAWQGQTSKAKILITTKNYFFIIRMSSLADKWSRIAPDMSPHPVLFLYWWKMLKSTTDPNQFQLRRLCKWSWLAPGAVTACGWLAQKVYIQRFPRGGSKPTEVANRLTERSTPVYTGYDRADQY